MADPSWSIGVENKRLDRKSPDCSTAAGALVGAIGSFFTLRLLSTILFRVPADDPWTLGVVLAVLAGVAMLAAWVPSRRAARVNPVEALRQE